MQNNNYM